MILRLYLRRSKGDSDHQQFSLDVQRSGCERFATERSFPWGEHIEYVDDDRAGDDFLGRAGLQRLLRETKSGDVVLCRDQSRLGRDALEVTLAVRELVRDRGAALYYYSTGQRVQMATAIDQATTFIQGVGGQMELEAIRSRTTEALRDRVRAGRLAGGSCYGYRNLRQKDASGREFTTAEVEPEQAKVVQRIFALYADGKGLDAIAKILNAEHVPPPRAGKRGTGSWSPSAVRSLLHNERYIGVYLHGRALRKRTGGKRVVSKADPSTWLRVEIPGWRIVSDDLWNSVIERFRRNSTPGRALPRSRHPLSGIAKCAVCGGGVVLGNTKIAGGKRVRAYVCGWHWARGSVVCPVAVRQPKDELEERLAKFLREEVLTPALIAETMAEVKKEIERRLAAKPTEDGEHEELERLRTEQRRCAKLLAKLDDAPELEAEYQARTKRIRELEATARASERLPALAAEMYGEIERGARAKLESLRAALGKGGDTTREIYRAIFPDGLLLRPQEGASAWEITGELDPNGYRAPGDNSSGDPTGTRADLALLPRRRFRLPTRLAA